jgi:hypothetical protein
MPAWLQAIGQHMQAVASAGIGAQAPLPHRLAQGFIGEQFADHLGRLLSPSGIGFVDAQSRPKHHAARLWLATGHTQTERVDLPARRRALRQRTGRHPRGQGSGESHAVQVAARPLCR